MLAIFLMLLQYLRVMLDKKCTRCKIHKLATIEFFMVNSKTHAMDIYCRCCRSELKRIHYSENRIKEIERVKKYNKSNPEKLALNMRKCRERRPEHFYLYQVEYRKNNKEQYRIHDKKKHAKRRGAINQTEHKATAKQIKELIRKSKNICYYCKSKCEPTIDHIQPLSKGGAHSLDNLVVACKSCNCSKCASNPYKFAQTKGMLLI